MRLRRSVLGLIGLCMLILRAGIVHAGPSATDFVGHGEGIGFKLGLTASNARGQADPNDPLWGITGGLFWSYIFVPRFSLQTDLHFTQGGTNATGRLTYLELALLPKVHFGERDRQRFSVYAGMTAGYEFGGDVYGLSDNGQYGLGTGVMWDHDNDELATRLDLRYTTSFNEIYFYNPESAVNPLVKNQALTLSVGMTFGSRRAKSERAVGHTHLEWKLGAAPGQRIRAELNDGSQIEGLFVAYQPDTLTLLRQQPAQRRSHSRRGEKSDSVSVVLADERKVGIAMQRVERLFVRKGAAGKGALIGAAIGALWGGYLMTQIDEDAFIDATVVVAPFVFVCSTVVGAVIGKWVGHWAAAYP